VRTGALIGYARVSTSARCRTRQQHALAEAGCLRVFVAWQSGEGALANVALDRALADDAGYSMATLLRQVIAAGAPPSLARLPMTPEEVAVSYDELEPPDPDDCVRGDSDDPCIRQQLGADRRILWWAPRHPTRWWARTARHVKAILRSAPRGR